MIKSISLIVLTQFLHFNELKILRQQTNNIFLQCSTTRFHLHFPSYKFFMQLFLTVLVLDHNTTLLKTCLKQ